MGPAPYRRRPGPCLPAFSWFLQCAQLIPTQEIVPALVSAWAFQPAPLYGCLSLPGSPPDSPWRVGVLVFSITTPTGFLTQLTHAWFYICLFVYLFSIYLPHSKLLEGRHRVFSTHQVSLDSSTKSGARYQSDG